MKPKNLLIILISCIFIFGCGPKKYITILKPLSSNPTMSKDQAVLICTEIAEAQADAARAMASSYQPTLSSNETCSGGFACGFAKSFDKNLKIGKVASKTRDAAYKACLANGGWYEKREKID